MLYKYALKPLKEQFTKSAWKYPQAIQDVDEFVSSWEQI